MAAQHGVVCRPVSVELCVCIVRSELDAGVALLQSQASVEMFLVRSEESEVSEAKSSNPTQPKEPRTV